MKKVLMIGLVSLSLASASNTIICKHSVDSMFNNARYALEYSALHTKEGDRNVVRYGKLLDHSYIDVKIQCKDVLSEDLYKKTLEQGKGMKKGIKKLISVL